MSQISTKWNKPSDKKCFPKKVMVYLLTVVLIFFGTFLPVFSSPSKVKVYYVGMLLGRGGLGDRSFNDSAYEGLRKAQRDYNIRFDIANFIAEEKNLQSLEKFARQGYDLIIGIGYESRSVVEKAARAFPNVRFAVVDVPAEGKNIASIVFREPEGDFIMGALATMLSDSRTVGFVGGMDIPIIRRIENGYRKGAEYQAPGVKVISGIAGSFVDPDRGKELAIAQYEAGADVIYNAAGRTGLGVIEAARKTGKLTIGTSGEQRYIAPGHVVGNRRKRVDKAVYMLIEDVAKKRFKPEIRSLGLKENGLTLGPFDKSIVTEDMRERIHLLKRKIMNGEIALEAVPK